MLASLRKYRNYRLYFAGQIVSYSGSWMQDTALPWLVLQRTHSPFQVGLLVFCRYGPFMVGGLYGGVVADRFDNRRVLICSQSFAMCVAAGLATVAFAGTGGLWLLYLLASGTGVALVFDNPSKHALIYQLVGRAELPNAVSLNVSLQNAAKVVGPALGGVLIAVAGSGWCFAVNAASFLAVLAALLAMRPAELFPVERGERQSGIRALREGVAYVRGSRLLRAILAVGAVLGLFGFSSLRTLLSVLADETLHGGPQTFGALFAAYGAGAVGGALASAALSRTGRRLLIGGAFLFSAPILALAPVRVTAVAAALLFVAGVGWATWSGQAFAQVQLAAPDRLRGRVDQPLHVHASRVGAARRTARRLARRRRRDRARVRRLRWRRCGRCCDRSRRPARLASAGAPRRRRRGAARRSAELDGLKVDKVGRHETLMPSISSRDKRRRRGG